MRYLPLFADLVGRPCLVVGGGSVGQRRVELLLEAGAEVTLIAPEITATLSRLAESGRIRLDHRAFDAQPLEPYWLVVAATDDSATNARVHARAEAAHRYCNSVDDPEHCSFILPAIIDRDPVTIAIGSAGSSPALTRWIKGLIEAVLPSRIGSFAHWLRGWRAAVRDALPNPVLRRRFLEHVVATKVLDAKRSASAAVEDAEMAAALEAWSGDGKALQGVAYLVGAGPGDPDLITLRGRQLLAQADLVLYDRLVHPKLLEFARREAELVSVGKMPGRPSMTQAQINRLLVEQVRAGKRVCRLKGGDPMVFGRAAEELEALAAAGLRFEIVPGVSAVEGCAAYAGIPLTARGLARQVVLATGHTDEKTMANLDGVAPGQTLALYMGVAHYEEVGARLIARGHAPETPAAIVERGTTNAQRIVLTTLAELAAASNAHEIRAPALLIVGETAALAARYAWFTAPISGRGTKSSAPHVGVRPQLA